MKSIRNYLHLLHILSLILVLYPCIGNAQVISKKPEDLFVVGSESIHFTSEITQSEYTLHINLPESYGKDPTKTYPVFYALDGYRIFGTTTHVYNGTWDDGFTPEIIIVGITNSGSKESPTLHRTRDLTPTAIERIATSGGGATFLKVLQDEIIPLTEIGYIKQMKQIGHYLGLHLPECLLNTCCLQNLPYLRTISFIILLYGGMTNIFLHKKKHFTKAIKA